MNTKIKIFTAADSTYTVYHYHLSDNFPYIPRSFYGIPDESFQNPARLDGPNGGPNGGQRQDPPLKE